MDNDDPWFRTPPVIAPFQAAWKFDKQIILCSSDFGNIDCQLEETSSGHFCWEDTQPDAVLSTHTCHKLFVGYCTSKMYKGSCSLKMYNIDIDIELLNYLNTLLL